MADRSIDRTSDRKSLRRAVHGASGLAGSLGALGIVVMTLGVALDVTKRQVTGNGIDGAIDVVGPLLVIVAFLSLAGAEMDHQHVALSVVTDRLPPRIGFGLILGGTLVSLALVLWMASSSLGVALDSLARGEIQAGIVKISLVPSRFAVVVGLVLLALQLSITALDAARSLRRGRPTGIWEERLDEIPEVNA